MDGWINMERLMNGWMYRYRWMDGWVTHQQSFSYLGTGLPGLMCLAQGYNTVLPVTLERTPSSSVSDGWIDT